MESLENKPFSWKLGLQTKWKTLNWGTLIDKVLKCEQVPGTVQRNFEI